MNEFKKSNLIRALKSRVGRGEGQKTQAVIAEEIGLDQPRVSRLVNGRFLRTGQDLRKLCQHLKVDIDAPEVLDPCKNKILVNALKRNWDGTPEHAQSLANMIDSINALANGLAVGASHARN
jgi:transcriptional regulator with XRE-family HTH domain